MAINYSGRKSGKQYRLPVDYLQVGNNLLTLSFKRRTWWRNLRGGGEVTLHLRGRDVKGHSVVIEDEQGVIEGIKAYIEANPMMGRMLGVKQDDEGHHTPESLAQAAGLRVLVKTTLQ
jgi:hypothetical protein